ncbi:hypothetical protein HOH67_02750 [Candidatus Peregrinibacteria bacterium]|jgi:Na+-transporting NADH:ubiquinone oxidoreductase subunit F|nr:hypothetical protein [Candidatus Peregrinibacteria bacterium]
MNTIKPKLVSVEKLTSDVFHYEFAFEAEPVDFTPGQFFILKVEDGKEPPVNRSYSIESAPRSDGFALCVKLIEGGRGSEYFRSMEVGATPEFMAPFGHFVLKEDDDKDIVMVATGTGLAPFMSMLRVLFERGFKRNIKLLFGVRHEEDLFYMDQLNAWAAEHENFELIVTLSRPEAEWAGEKGRVTEHFDAMSIESSQVYICGGGQMVKDIREMALNKGLEKSSIYFEQFTSI